VDESDLFVRPVGIGEGIQGYLQQEQDLNPEPFTEGLILSDVLLSRKFNYSCEWTRCSLKNSKCKVSNRCRIYVMTLLVETRSLCREDECVRLLLGLSQNHTINSYGGMGV